MEVDLISQIRNVEGNGPPSWQFHTCKPEMIRLLSWHSSDWYLSTEQMSKGLPVYAAFHAGFLLENLEGSLQLYMVLTNMGIRQVTNAVSGILCHPCVSERCSKSLL